MNGDRVGYLDMRRLLQSRASVFASGRLQEGAYLHRAPCVTLRLETSGGENGRSELAIGCGKGRNMPRGAIPMPSATGRAAAKAVTFIVDTLKFQPRTYLNRRPDVR
jgi:hypothetical protein